MIFNAPGFVFSYQNANFILAAAMMERCTGKSWEDMMKTELFQPLGMAGREVFDAVELVSPRALGAFDVAVELGPLRRQDEEAQVALQNLG